MADSNNKIDNKKEVKEPDLSEEENDIVYEKLKKSKFKQQAVPTWRPKPTVTSTTIVFVCFEQSIRESKKKLPDVWTK